MQLHSYVALYRVAQTLRMNIDYSDELKEKGMQELKNAAAVKTELDGVLGNNEVEEEEVCSATRIVAKQQMKHIYDLTELDVVGGMHQRSGRSSTVPEQMLFGSEY